MVALHQLEGGCGVALSQSGMPLGCLQPGSTSLRFRCEVTQEDEPADVMHRLNAAGLGKQGPAGDAQLQRRSRTLPPSAAVCHDAGRTSHFQNKNTSAIEQSREEQKERQGCGYSKTTTTKHSIVFCHWSKEQRDVGSSLAGKAFQRPPGFPGALPTSPVVIESAYMCRGTGELKRR